MSCIEEREKWLGSHFFIKSEIVQCHNDLNIERRKDFWGLSNKKNKVILPTIYDDIKLIDSTLACVCIDEKYGFFDVNLTRWIIEPFCESYSINDYYRTIEIIQNNKHGLINIDDNRLLISPHYDNVSINSRCNYIWVEQNGLYHYVKRSSGEFLNMPGALDAYDTSMIEDVMFIKKNNDIVKCVNENGDLATTTFRRIMKKNHGRLKLYNSKKHSFIVIDIYGRILNQ